jgi:hypothetical protein
MKFGKAHGAKKSHPFPREEMGGLRILKDISASRLEMHYSGLLAINPIGHQFDANGVSERPAAHGLCQNR